MRGQLSTEIQAHQGSTLRYDRWDHSNPWLIMKALGESNTLKPIMQCKKVPRESNAPALEGYPHKHERYLRYLPAKKMLIYDCCFQFLVLSSLSSILVSSTRIVHSSPAPWFSMSSMAGTTKYFALYVYHWIASKEMIRCLQHSAFAGWRA